MLNELIGDKPVFLVASAISGYTETKLPSGQGIVNNLFSYIFSEYCSKEYKWLEKLFNNLPFEAINECFPVPNRIREILQKQFLLVKPNPLHDALAEKLNKGEISCLITPNYDMAFDIALSKGKVTKLYSTKCCERFNRSLKHTPIYFKIHGCAEAPESLIFSLSQEKKLDVEKRKTLAHVLNSKCLVVMGYSGRDFDICPLISRKNIFKYNRIIWLRYPDSLSSHFENQLLSSNLGNVVIEGDIKKFIEKLSNCKFNTVYLPDVFDAKNLFKLTEEERIQWQIAILERLNCSSLGLLTLKKHKQVLNNDFILINEISFLYWSGQTQNGLEKSIVLNRILNPTSREYQSNLENIAAKYMGRGCIFDLTKSLYMMFRAKVNAQCNFPDDKEIRNRILHREIVYWGVVGKTYLFLYPFTHTLRIIKASKLMKSLDDVSWPQKQGILLALERINSRWIKLPNEVQNILEPIKGFNNLGSPGHEMVAYMDDLYHQRKFDKKQFTKTRNIAKKLGAYEMLWKLYRTAAITSKSNHRQRSNYFRLWKKYMNKCDYGRVFRIRNLVQYYFEWLLFKTNIG
jgi:NAD-dependent SIR2 family protein deacetylase